MIKISDTKHGKFEIETDHGLTLIETQGHNSFFITSGRATLVFTLYYEKDYIIAYYHVTYFNNGEPVLVPGDIVLRLYDGYLSELGYRLEKILRNYA